MMFDNDTDVTELLERVAARAQTEIRQPSPVEEDTTRTTGEDTLKWWIPGICGQTRVTTNFGEVPAQLLRVGDRVRTRSGRYLAIKRISEAKLDNQFVEQHPDANPVRIPKGSLGQQCPSQDVFLSPAQTLRVRTTDNKPELVRAKTLSQNPMAFDKTLDFVAYYEIFLGEEDDICCEGLWVRSSCAQ